MVKVYAVALVAGLAGLIVLILGGAFAENVNRPERDPGKLAGRWGKVGIGALTGFGMGGLSAEFSPRDLSWQAALAVALVATAFSAAWVWYSSSRLDAE